MLQTPDPCHIDMYDILIIKNFFPNVQFWLFNEDD
jgi:hypothetical protein